MHAAIDCILGECISEDKLSVYTYGAPRVGNYKFSRIISERQAYQINCYHIVMLRIIVLYTIKILFLICHHAKSTSKIKDALKQTTHHIMLQQRFTIKLGVITQKMIQELVSQVKIQIVLHYPSISLSISIFGDDFCTFGRLFFSVAK